MLKKELEKLGFTDKESSVYLAAVELGPSSVQKIANKAKVKRATTYVMIEELIERGLMSTFTEGKKTIYVAEKPERVLDFLERQKEEAEKKIADFKDILPEISSFFNTNGDRPKVKYYEGIEGLRAVQDDFVESLKKGDEIFTFLPYDDFYGSELVSKLGRTTERRVEKEISSKVIYTSRTGRKMDYEKKERTALKECFFVDFEKYPFRGGMNVYGNKVFLISYLGNPGGVVIENSVIADLMKTFFLIIWKNRSAVK